MEHLKGPWTISDDDSIDGEEDIHIEYEGVLLATVRGSNDMLCVDEDVIENVNKVVIATAKLISAAPDLLEALEKLLDHVTVDSLRTNWEDVIKLTTSAIAKSKDL